MKLFRCCILYLSGLWRSFRYNGCLRKDGDNMKRQIAMMITLILAAGTFTACTSEEKMNNDDIQTSVVITADVSVYSQTSEPTTTLQRTETETAEKSTVSKETESGKKDTKTKEKSDSGQNSADVSATEPPEKVKADVRQNNDTSNNEPKKKSESNTSKATKASTQKPSAKPTQLSVQKAIEKPTQKPTQPSIKAKTVDVNSAISYGKQLGMNYDSSLNTGNASWFSPTNASYYDDTQSLTADCYGDVEYVAYYYQSSGIAPSNLSFNVITENNKIYVVYC